MVPGGAPVVFVDRDGTLIRDVNYLSRPEQIELLPGVPEAIQLLRRSGLKVVVVTNQSGVGRGYFREDELEQIHRELKRQLAIFGAFLDAIYYCPHHPTEGMGPYQIFCECRKPNVGLLKRAAAEWGLDLGWSYVVGDQPSDMEMAARIGAKGILIRNEKAEGRPQEAETKFLAVKDLWEAAHWITRDFQGKR